MRLVVLYLKSPLLSSSPSTIPSLTEDSSESAWEVLACLLVDLLVEVLI